MRAQFIRSYAAVPSKLRREIIALVEGQPYNWNSAYVEISQKTKTGDTILRHLAQIGILPEEAAK